MKDRPGSEDHLSEHLPVLQRLGWVLVLHVDPPDFIEHERFIRALPTVTIIDHMARVRGKDGLDQPAFRILLDLLKDVRSDVAELSSREPVDLAALEERLTALESELGQRVSSHGAIIQQYSKRLTTVLWLVIAVLLLVLFK